MLNLYGKLHPLDPVYYIFRQHAASIYGFVRMFRLFVSFVSFVSFVCQKNVGTSRDVARRRTT